MAITRYETSRGEPRWRVEWRIPGRVKRRRVFTTEREARAFEAQMRVAPYQGDLIDPRRGDRALSEVYASWLATRVDVTAKVRRGYEDNWKTHVAPAFGAWPVRRIDSMSIQAWVNAMTAGEHAVGPRTQRWRHTVLKQVLDHAVDQRLIVKNPAAATVFPRLVRYQAQYLTAAEVTSLSELCGPQQGDVVLILAYTGLRWGELTALNVADVNLVSRRVHVRRSMTQVGGKLVSGAPKSETSARTVPIPGLLVPVLRDRIEGRAGTDPAVTSPRGRRLSRENWVRDVRWKDQTEALGRPRFRLHDLRHTYASLARMSGADLRLLQKTLGHASVTTTAHIYADLFDDELDAVADALDRLAQKPHAGGGPPQAHRSDS